MTKILELLDVDIKAFVLTMVQRVKVNNLLKLKKKKTSADRICKIFLNKQIH
jgi:hypothetical protein